MSKVNDGGPAFPRPKSFKEDGTSGVRVISCDEGMTLRDWFAGQALAGLMASPVEVTGKDLAEAHQKAADICYSAADAMLAAREPQP